MSEFRDSAGRRLEDYPRPSVAVDTAVLTVDADRLCVGLLERPEARRLPGTFLHEGEVLSDAVRRSLADKAGIVGLRPQQLRVFDAPGRDDRGWVLSVAHLAVVPVARLASSAVVPVPVDEAVGLQFDHDEIVRIATDWLRTRYREEPDPEHLLPDRFTLRDLQLLHQAVAGAPLMRDRFRRGMERRLRDTGERMSGIVGKPPRLFERMR